MQAGLIRTLALLLALGLGALLPSAHAAGWLIKWIVGAMLFVTFLSIRPGRGTLGAGHARLLAANVAMAFAAWGLGLAAGGRIDLESELGQGTTFAFTVPPRMVVVAAAATSKVASVVVTADAGMAAAHPMKILVAEDNAVNRRMMETMLKRFGYTADFAEDGKLAVAALHGKRYDLVFMDMQMPEMDGCTAARTFRQWERASQRPPVPIVALTAKAMAGDREKFLGASMNIYLTKPLKLDELRRVLTQAASGQPISAGA